jgi:hypothetical protein
MSLSLTVFVGGKLFRLGQNPSKCTQNVLQNRMVVLSLPTIKVPYYEMAVHSLQHRSLSPDQELGKSPVFLHFHMWIGPGVTGMVVLGLGIEVPNIWTLGDFKFGVNIPCLVLL